MQNLAPSTDLDPARFTTEIVDPADGSRPWVEHIFPVDDDPCMTVTVTTYSGPREARWGIEPYFDRKVLSDVDACRRAAAALLAACDLADRLNRGEEA